MVTAVFDTETTHVAPCPKCHSGKYVFIFSVPPYDRQWLENNVWRCVDCKINFKQDLQITLKEK